MVHMKVCSSTREKKTSPIKVLYMPYSSSGQRQPGHATWLSTARCTALIIAQSQTSTSLPLLDRYWIATDFNIDITAIAIGYLLNFLHNIALARVES